MWLAAAEGHLWSEHSPQDSVRCSMSWFKSELLEVFWKSGRLPSPQLAFVHTVQRFLATDIQLFQVLGIWTHQFVKVPRLARYLQTFTLSTNRSFIKLQNQLEQNSSAGCFAFVLLPLLFQCCLQPLPVRRPMCYTHKKAVIASDVPTRHHHQSPPASVNIHHKDCSCLHSIAALT